MNWLNEVLNNDPDPAESQEWIESLKAVIDHDGPARAHQLPNGMVEPTRRAGAHLPFAPTTAYINPLHPAQDATSPRDPQRPCRTRPLLPRHAVAELVRANATPAAPGGPIAPFSSTTTPPA